MCVFLSKNKIKSEQKTKRKMMVIHWRLACTTREAGKTYEIDQQAINAMVETRAAQAITTANATRDEVGGGTDNIT